jgi:3-methyladenine DNA glycosylase AlkD
MYRSHANPARALPMRRYMKDQFDFFGIQTPARRDIDRAFLQAHGLPDDALLDPLIEMLWADPHRDCQYFGVDLLRRFSNRLDAAWLPRVEWMITHRSWWDTVDGLAADVAGPLLAHHPDSIEPCTNHWIESDNFWLQRTAILFQLRYKARTDESLLSRIILRRAFEREFFVRKAIGWALREYSKTNPTFVKRFVARYAAELSPLSQREALKVLARKKASAK